MDPGKPLYLKTYGRQKRRVSAWILPDKRKQAFDSTGSSEGDISVFEPAKRTTKRESKTSVASRRAMRPAKKNAMVCLTEKSHNENMSDEENVNPCPPSPQPAKESKKNRVRKTSVASRRSIRPTKKNAMVCLTEKSHNEENIRDEENIFIPSPPCPQPAKQSKKTSGKADRCAKRKNKFLTENCSDEENIDLPPLPQRQPAQQSKTTSRKSRLVSVPEALMRRKRQHDPITSESEEDSRSSIKSHKTSVQMNNLPSTGRFVTRRRRAVSTNSKPPKVTVGVLNSSDDFHTSRLLQPSKRRRVPLSFLASSVENSVNTAGTSSSATNPFREISLNESTDHSLGPGSRKPIFCSTPSASSFSKCPHVKPSPINDQASPPSISVSCIGLLSTFQEDLDSPGQPHTPALVKQSSLDEKQPGLHYSEEPSSELLFQGKNMNKMSSCSELAKSHGEDWNTKNSGTLPSLNLLTTDSESSSHFVSAAGGLEWLIEALKENCLTWRCTVQLERLDILTVTQLCSETTYSSCLGHSSSVHSRPTNEHSLSVDSGHTLDPASSSKPPFSLCLSVTNEATADHLQSTNNSFESSAPDSRNTNLSLSVDYKQSAEHSSTVESIEQSTSVLNDESTHYINSSVDFVMGTQLPADSPVQTVFTGEEAVAVKNKCLNKKLKVQLKALTLSQRSVWQLKDFREAGFTCDDKSNLDSNEPENDHTYNIEEPEDLTSSREIAERMTAVRQPPNGAVAQLSSNDPETLETMLKDKCLNDKFIVEINRLTLSQLRENLQRKGTKLKSSTDVSDSASDDQTKSNHQSESDTNHCKGGTSSINVNKKKRGSTSSGNNINSDKDVKRPKRRKNSMAPREKKRRSTSTDRPGTTRKACVSGLSVSRWKSKNGTSTHMFKSRTAQGGGSKTVDCSINELISTQPKQQQQELFGTTMNFSTPVRASRLNFSSLLADLTPNTHTWSRLKAALSVHRKGMVLLTPRSLHQSVSGTPARAELPDVSQDLFATPFRTPLSRRFQSQLMSCNSLVEDAHLSDAEKVYAECDQQGPLPWEECILPQRMKQCVKIGEGTFGEVFSTTNASGDTVALKIIPLEGSEKVNGEDQKTFGEILHEIIISKELSSLKEKQQNQTHGFIGLNDLHCVRGCYPPDFLNAWDNFDQHKGSENDRPDFFQQDQLFIILEFEFGGTDLENSNGTLASLVVAKSILHQVTAALAVAEEELNFEHRDLHWGNVLVKTTKQKKGSFVLNGTPRSLETKGVLVRIIDYSLSRLEIDDLTVSCDISKDEELFMGQGDYQFDIYRLMRQENGNNWSNYHPHTNVLWLHYLCSKLLSMKYRGKGGRAAKDIREELTRFYDNVLQYSSATEALQSCPMFQ